MSGVPRLRSKRVLLIVVGVLVLAACGGDDDSDDADASVTSTTDAGCVTNDSDPDGLEPLMVDEIAPAFSLQPDEAFDTGPSDLAKAVADDGQDDAREVLTSLGFRRGYQRIWTDDEENQVIVFVYEFCDPASANAYVEHITGRSLDEARSAAGLRAAGSSESR